MTIATQQQYEQVRKEHTELLIEWQLSFLKGNENKSLLPKLKQLASALEEYLESKNLIVRH